MAWREAIELEARTGNEKLAANLMAKALQPAECPDSGILWAYEVCIVGAPTLVELEGGGGGVMNLPTGGGDPPTDRPSSCVRDAAWSEDGCLAFFFTRPHRDADRRTRRRAWVARVVGHASIL